MRGDSGGHLEAFCTLDAASKEYPLFFFEMRTCNGEICYSFISWKKKMMILIRSHGRRRYEDEQHDQQGHDIRCFLQSM